MGARGPRPQPCGTLAAYKRHQRHGEVPCYACLDARNDQVLAPYRRAVLAAAVYANPRRRRAAFLRGDLP